MRKYKITLFSLALLLGISFGPLQLVHAEIVDSNQGTANSTGVTDSGDTVKTDIAQGTWGSTDWSLDDSGTLHLNGGTIGTSDGRPWMTKDGKDTFVRNNYAEQILKVSIDSPVIVGTDASYLFANLTRVKSYVGLNNLDTSKVTDMSYMFSNNSVLQDVDLSGLKTANVKTMNSMFMSTSGLRNVDMSNWVISVDNITKTLIPRSTTGIKTLTLKNTQINKSDFIWLNWSGSQFINLGSTTIDNPVILKTVAYDKLSDAVNDDTAGNLPGSLGIWTKEPEKVSSSIGLGLSYKYSVDGKNDTRNFTIPKEDVPIYVGAVIEVPVEEKAGYVPSQKTVRYITYALRFELVDLNTFVTYTKIEYYSGNGKLTYQSNLGPQEMTLTDANQHAIGSEFEIEVNNIKGYDVSPSKITVQVVNKNTLAVVDGAIGGTNYVTYTPTAYIGNGEVNIPNNLDREIVGQAESIDGLVFNDEVDITVPDQTGFTKDKTTIKARVNADGNLEIINPETDGLVTYTKNSTGGGGTTTDPEPVDKYETKHQTATVYSDKESIKIYDSQGNVINNRELAKLSNWFSDQIWTAKDGQQYYRVATNEWVKVEDVYLYEATPLTVTTKDVSEYVTLVDEYGKFVQNRALGVATDWLVDKTVTINGEKYYRVASNEFVSANDVDISQFN